MNYIWSHLKHRAFLTVLTVIAVTVTVALFSLLLMSKDGVEQGARQGYGPFEVVIGADGSESQLVLNTFYRVGAPVGNVPYDTLQQVRDSGQAEAVYGMTTGDSHEGYPIVGIDPTYFQTRYEDRSLSDGKLYGQQGEVTVGYTVAKALDLKIGDTFSGAHGLVEHVDIADDHHEEEAGHAEEEGHEEEAGHAEEEEHADMHESFVYTVTGILPKLGTADDRAIFTTMDYAWAVHELSEDEREITAIIVKPATLLGAQTVKQQFDELDNVQAVYSSKAVADVLNMVDNGSQLLMIVMLICALLAASTLLLALMSSVQERKRDVGLLRLIGKSRTYILSCLIGEGVALSAAGIVLGVAAGHIIAALLGDLVFTVTGIQLEALRFATNEWLLMAGALVIGALASAGPALRVYRTDALALFRN